MSGCFYFPSNVKEILNGKMLLAKKCNKDKKRQKKSTLFILQVTSLSLKQY